MSETNGPQSQSSRQQEAHDRLRSMILRGVLRPGVLHSESELAEQLGMSRTPVRSALAVLSREGIVESIPQVGVRVRVIPKEEMEEIFALRLALETLVATELAKKAGQVSLEELDRNLDATRAAAAARDKPTFLEVSTQFHYIIARLAGFRQAMAVLQTLRDKLRIVGIAAVTGEPHMEQVISEHTAIRDAIARGDHQTAVDLLRAHLGATKDRLARAAEHTI